MLPTGTGLPQLRSHEGGLREHGQVAGQDPKAEGHAGLQVIAPQGQEDGGDTEEDHQRL